MKKIMKTLNAILGVILCCSFVSCTKDHDPAPDPIPQPSPDDNEEPGDEGQSDSLLIFEDNFEQTEAIPDTTKWELCAKGSSAWNTYMSCSYDQAYVADGMLVLKAEKVNGVYKAGGVRMRNNKAFKYGRLEVSARFTKTAQGSWPAIWMMPSAPVWSGWPQCGEIDIMEHLNNESSYWSVIHTYYTDTYNSPCNTNDYCKLDTFNTYAIEWTAKSIKFFFNDKPTLEYTNKGFLGDTEEQYKQWPFDTTFYLILNNALGGAGTWPGAISDSQLPAIFEVDWVKVSALPEK